MPHRTTPSPISILLVDDDAGDVVLTRKALEDSKLINTLDVAKDGVEAMEYLLQKGTFTDAKRPDLILLDLNMPRKDGRETLMEIKRDPGLNSIPIVILTTSNADRDVVQRFDLQATSYVTKPVDLAQFTEIVCSLSGFWFCLVTQTDDPECQLVKQVASIALADDPEDDLNPSGLLSNETNGNHSPGIECRN